jgi:hypothetical protein
MKESIIDERADAVITLLSAIPAIERHAVSDYQRKTTQSYPAKEDVEDMFHAKPPNEGWRIVTQIWGN